MPISTVLGDVAFPQNGGVISDGSPNFPLPPSGYDAVIQFSNRLLNQALNFNLQQDGLNILSARVPYQSGQLTPGLQAVAAAQVRHPDEVASVSLEVVLLSPAVSSLYVFAPPVIDVNSSGALPSARSRSVGRFASTANITWVIQVNLFQPTLRATAAQPASTPPPAGGARGLGVDAVNGGFATVATAEPLVGGGLPSGSRMTIARGTALMHGTMSVGVAANLFRFCSQVDCGASPSTYQSTDAAMTEFLATPLATALLAQAVAPLVNGYLTRISPTVALAGNLNAGQVAALHLPAMHVAQEVLSDSSGQILTLCATLGPSSTGGSVGSLLGGNDFCGYVGERVFRPVLLARWNANALRVPVVAEVPVELPVSQGSTQTGQGVARIQVSLSETLQQARLEPSDTYLGDPLQLISQQTVRLLRMWNPGGDEVTDLGTLADPAVVPLVINLQLYDKLPAGATQNVHPMVQAFLTALMAPLYVPIVEKLHGERFTGFASSSLHAVLLRWRVPRANLADSVGLAPGVNVAVSG